MQKKKKPATDAMLRMLKFVQMDIEKCCFGDFFFIFPFSHKPNRSIENPIFSQTKQKY